MAERLLRNGADANAADHDGWTPLHWACQNGHGDVARLLLVDHGADANAADNTGETPLHVACSGGHGDIARLLLERGADPGRDRGHFIVRQWLDARALVAFGGSSGATTSSP